MYVFDGIVASLSSWVNNDEMNECMYVCMYVCLDV